MIRVECKPTARVFSVGSSNHTWPNFLRLLSTASIQVLIDVRSRPRSRLPHFNQGPLASNLGQAGISYLFMGESLGGMPSIGPADYEAMAQTSRFGQALAAVSDAARDGAAILMCSEGEPLQCHRFLLVSRALAELGEQPVHILRDGRHEPHSATEDRLLALTRQTIDGEGDRREACMRAYRKQNRRVTGYDPDRASAIVKGEGRVTRSTERRGR